MSYAYYGESARVNDTGDVHTWTELLKYVRMYLKVVSLFKLLSFLRSFKYTASNALIVRYNTCNFAIKNLNYNENT